MINVGAVRDKLQKHETISWGLGEFARARIARHFLVGFGRFFLSQSSRSSRATPAESADRWHTVYTAKNLSASMSTNRAGANDGENQNTKSTILRSRLGYTER